MLCDLCQESPATIFFTVELLGEKIDQSLCQTCATPLSERLTQPIPANENEMAPPKRPAEIILSEPIQVSQLAEVLHLTTYQVVGALIPHQIFTKCDTSLDFNTASLVCTHFGTTPQKAN
ncbi:hypothetical protein FEM03_05140 [Phragmitibacter flavus]|uniref:Translation initiation factor IF-2 N-terminal domain-containing protein n=1 Tax=Phragmitibacter flavus TaxID=2576071 RepID=A0A5R8KIH1_9BACT|nr:hypothetical protein [Phragmitibacter flavus]TLD72114.1 hypothetical protein FEM03_05140 [Phragmitibacter flavus]